jgi:hypothetical protein
MRFPTTLENHPEHLNAPRLVLDFNDQPMIAAIAFLSAC